MAKTLHFRTEGALGEWYAVDEQGRITRPEKHKWMTPSDTWLFLGVARRWNRNGIDIRLPEAFANPGSLKGTYVFDNDHGTRRRWGWRIDKLVSPYVDEV